MSVGRPSSLRRIAIAIAAMVIALVGRPSTVEAQVCVSLLPHSCMTVTYTPNATTPSANDFANGMAVVGSFTLNVLKCGRTPCRVTLGAQGQPSGGLRVRVGGAMPATLADCPIDVSGVSSPNSSNAPIIMETNVATTFVVWVCRPLSWNPATTPIGTTSMQMRFLLRQG